MTEKETLILKAYKNKAEILTELKRYDEAIDCYNDLLKFEPDKLENLFNKAHTLKLAKKHEESLRLFDELIEKLKLEVFDMYFLEEDKEKSL